MFTNYLTRGSICLQDQYAANDSCAVLWALDVSKPSTGKSPEPELSVCRAAESYFGVQHQQKQPTMAAKSRKSGEMNDSTFQDGAQPSSFFRLHFCQNRSHPCYSFLLLWRLGCLFLVGCTQRKQIRWAHREQAPDMCFTPTIDWALAFLLLVLSACIRWAVMVCHKGQEV